MDRPRTLVESVQLYPTKALRTRAGKPQAAPDRAVIGPSQSVAPSASAARTPGLAGVRAQHDELSDGAAVNFSRQDWHGAPPMVVGALGAKDRARHGALPHDLAPRRGRLAAVHRRTFVSAPPQAATPRRHRPQRPRPDDR